MSQSRLFVSGLTKQTSSQDLYDMFSPFGEVVDDKAWMDLDKCECKGWGFVEMAKEIEAYNARSALDGKRLDGKQLRVKESRS